jgi:hypothetical protein
VAVVPLQVRLAENRLDLISAALESDTGFYADPPAVYALASKLGVTDAQGVADVSVLLSATARAAEDFSLAASVVFKALNDPVAAGVVACEAQALCEEEVQ